MTCQVKAHHLTYFMPLAETFSVLSIHADKLSPFCSDTYLTVNIGCSFSIKAPQVQIYLTGSGCIRSSALVAGLRTSELSLETADQSLQERVTSRYTELVGMQKREPIQ